MCIPWNVLLTMNFIGLQRGLRQVPGAASRVPGIGEFVPIEPMSWTSAPAVDVLESQAAEHAPFAPIDMGGSGQRRKLANGRGFKKVAVRCLVFALHLEHINHPLIRCVVGAQCNSCSDAHKKCDQGHPCGRCKSRGIKVCVYPLTKRAGRSTRRKGASVTTGDGE